MYAFRLSDGRHGACQVVAEHASGRKRQVEIVTLDYLGRERPTLAHSIDLAPLKATWADGNGGEDRCIVDERVPWWLERIGVAPARTFPKECGAYGRWESALGVLHRDNWNNAGLGPRARDATPVSVDVGGGATTLRRDAWQATIGPGGLMPPARGAIRFEALDAFPALGKLSYTGSDPRFVKYVTERKIMEVAWHGHGQRTVDLRASSVTELALDVGDEDVTLRGPPTLTSLTIIGDAGKLTIDGVHLGFPFRLSVRCARPPAPPRGAGRVECVDHEGVLAMDASVLAAYDELAALRIWGAPGKLTNACALSSLSQLRELEIYELYDLDAGRFPRSLALLEGAVVHGLRRADAELLKEALAEVPDVRITGARDDRWIEANLDNPFRAWEEDSPALGRAACATWKKAKLAATALSPGAAKEARKAVLETLVASLNRLDEKYDIDTLRREQAAEAFSDLAREMGIGYGDAMRWFDGWRNF